MWSSVFITYLLFLCLYYSNNNSINIIIFFIESKYKGDNSVKKGDSPLKRSGPDCTCANTDYFIARF